MQCHCCKEDAPPRDLAAGSAYAPLCAVHDRAFATWLRDTSEWANYHLARAAVMQAIHGGPGDFASATLEALVNLELTAARALQDAVWGWLDSHKFVAEPETGGKVET